MLYNSSVEGKKGAQTKLQSEQHHAKKQTEHVTHVWCMMMQYGWRNNESKQNIKQQWLKKCTPTSERVWPQHPEFCVDSVI